MVKADLREFFPSIQRPRVQRVLQEAGLNQSVAALIAALVCIDGSVAAGLSPAPVISNLVAVPLDVELTALAAEFDCKYTRYADDITVSTRSASGALPTKSRLASLIEKHSFRLHSGKFREVKPGQAYFVTGLSVQRFPPTMPKNWRRRLRQELYFCTRSVEEHVERSGRYDTVREAVNSISGRLAFLRSVQPVLARKLMADWTATLAAQDLSVTYVARTEMPASSIELFIDEAELEIHGSRRLALACVVIDEPEKLRNALDALCIELRQDPYTLGRKATLSKKGLHYTDLHEEARSKLIHLLSEFSFSVYLGHRVLDDYASTYFEILQAVLRGRLAQFDRSEMSVTAEQNNQVKAQALQHSVAALYRMLETSAGRRPFRTPNVQVKGKLDEPLFSVPDTLLGIWAQYLATDRTDSNLKRFERLRSRYRMILDVNTGQYFGRRHPLVL